jgi:hypothetical protein
MCIIELIDFVPVIVRRQVPSQKINENRFACSEHRTHCFRIFDIFVVTYEQPHRRFPLFPMGSVPAVRLSVLSREYRKG